jgi:hypothetical protein
MYQGLAKTIDFMLDAQLPNYMLSDHVMLHPDLTVRCDDPMEPKDIQTEGFDLPLRGGRSNIKPNTRFGSQFRLSNRSDSSIDSSSENVLYHPLLNTYDS